MLSDAYRRDYAAGIEKYIARMNQECKQWRRGNMNPEKLVENPERFRAQYIAMLGLDKFAAASTKPVSSVYVGSDDVGAIYRLTVYITDEIPFYAMLIIPHCAHAPMPLVVTQHGGGGTPELCSDMYGANNYNHMVQRILSRGAAALVPQLLMWAKTEGQTTRGHDIPYDRFQTDIDLKRFGSSITALEIAGIMKSLDYVNGLEQIDETRIGMIGLSYGGFYTLYTMAADSRIKAGYCAGIFNDQDVYPKLDRVFMNSANLFQNAEVAALCAPRKLYVQVGKTDDVFDYSSACRESERVFDYFAAYGCPQNFQFDVWDGGHTVSDHDKGYAFLFDALGE